MPVGDYLVGLAFFAGTVGAVGIGTWLVVRRRLPSLGGAPLVLAFFLVGAAGLIAVHLLPGALAILSRESVLVTALGALALATRVSRAEGPPTESARGAEGAASSLSWAIAAVALLIVAAYTFTALHDTATSAVTDIDAMSFTFPGIVSWIQEGTVWQNAVLIPGFPVGAYPNNGDTLYLAAMLPWSNDAFVRPVAFLLVAFTGLAVYALARELRAPRSSAVLFAALVLTVRVLMVPAIENAKPDVFMTATFTAGLVFLVRHARTRATPDLVLAGVGLGLGFGARWYGVLFAPAALAVWALALRLGGVSWRRAGKMLVGCGAVVLAAGGFWLLRNWVAIANPFFPVKIELLGVTVFDAGADPIRERYGFSIAHYLGDWDVLRNAVFPDWKEAFGLPGALLVAALLAAAAAVGVRWRRARRLTRVEATVLALAGLALLLEVIYISIPATAQGPEGRPFEGLVGGNSRYAVPGLLVGAALAAWLCGRIGRARIVLEVGALVALVDGIGRSFAIPVGRVALYGALGLAALAACALVVGLVRRMPRTVRRRAAVALTAVAALALVAAGHQDQKSFNERRYRGFDPVIDALNVQPEGTRVGIVDGSVGFVPIHVAAGPRFGSDVEYVGYFDKGQLRRFRRAEPFRTKLRREEPDLLLVGKGVPPMENVRWARWAAREGYERVRESETFLLMRRDS